MNTAWIIPGMKVKAIVASSESLSGGRYYNIDDVGRIYKINFPHEDMRVEWLDQSERIHDGVWHAKFTDVIPQYESNQQVFDIVAKHLLTQNDKSISPQGVCQYRHDKGLMCAAGVLLPDHIVNPYWNSFSILTVGPRAAFDSLNLDIDFVRDLQIIHDFHGVREWHSSLMRFAQNNDIDPAGLFQFDPVTYSKAT